MVSYCGKRCDVISSRLSRHFWVKMHVFSTSFFAISAMPIMPIRSLSANSLSPVLLSLDSTGWRGTARSLWNSWLGWPSYQPYSHSRATRETMASDPEGQLSDWVRYSSKYEVSEVVINCLGSKDNLWRWCGLKITTRPSRCACRNIECTSIRVCLACVVWRFCVVLSGARLSGEAAPVAVSWPTPAFII